MKLKQEDIGSIVVFRALQLGDMLCCIPAVRALRHAYPAAHITLFGLPWAEGFTRRFNMYFDRFIHFPGYPGLPEQDVDPRKNVSFLTRVQEERFDLVLQMQGSGSIVNPLVELFGAKNTAGFFTPGDYCPDARLFLEYPGHAHEIERHLALMQFLGIADNDTDLEFPLSPRDNDEFEALRLPVAAKQYVCLHPGSRASWRQWPTAFFALLGDYCTAKGLDVVLTGTADELPIVSEVAGKMKKPPVIAAGQTTIGAAAVLIQRSLLLISNCTGVSHIAAALRIPSVVISMDGEPNRWGPLNTELHKTIDWTKHPEFSLVMAALTELLELHWNADHRVHLMRDRRDHTFVKTSSRP